MDFNFYVSLFLRRLPYFAICLALGTALGVTTAAVLPPTFVARAQLLMEAAQIPGNLASSTVVIDPVEQMQVLEQRIMTRANLLELANRLEIYKGSPDLPADTIVTDMRQRVKITKKVQQTASNRGNTLPSVLVDVSFDSNSSALSSTVANEIVTLILQENVEMRTVVAGQTLDFFVQEVDRLEKELTKLSEQILKFKQDNKDALPESLEFRRSQQVVEQGRLATLETDQTALKDRRKQLVALYDATGQVTASTSQQTPEQKQLQALNDQLTNSMAILSPTNPRVMMLKSQIAALQKIVAAQTSAVADTATGQTLDPYQVQLADLDAQIAYLDEQRIKITKRLDDLQRSIEATPGVTLQIDTLNRDYANVRQQYDNAVAAKARAETGELIETLSKGQRISVLEQAIPPQNPTSPNRPLIAIGGVGGGFALGLAIVVLLELMNRSIRRPIELTKRLGITPFATLPYMRTRRESTRRLVMIVLALLIVLTGIPAGLWAVDHYYMPLDQLIDKIVKSLGMTSLIDQLRQSFGG